ncbi:thermonuclease family protein [Bacillus alkalicellulosilyticus]|uniref:thermonuclease family protein n=1 Tax=Alkalihalobacterium alkalicellulosilyticum TaxID=1912214 RepID=UPI0009967C66|nr:thermonuclease family protein [Bacillus alkalicellulosilyticus]
MNKSKVFFLSFTMLVVVACQPVEKLPHHREEPVLLKEEITVDVSAEFHEREKIEKESLVTSSDIKSDLDKGNWLIGTVERVIDGDTVIVNDLDFSLLKDEKISSRLASMDNSVRVRFLAIDTPEYTDEVELFGKESTEFVKDLVEGQAIYLEIDPKADFDRFDRSLAHVFTENGTNVQEALLANGLARVAYLFDEYKYVDLYLKAQERAMTNKLNVHSIDGYVTDKGFDMSVIPRDEASLSDISVTGLTIEDVIRLLKKVNDHGMPRRSDIPPFLRFNR